MKISVWQRRQDIRFAVAPRLDYGWRMAIVAAGLVLGIVLQLLCNVWLGLAVIILGMLFSLLRSQNLSPKAQGDEKWQQVTPDEYAKVKKKQAQIEKWDFAYFDASNLIGVVILLQIGAVYFGVVVKLDQKFAVALIDQWWVLDALVIVVMQWFSGMKFMLDKADLIKKIELLEKMMTQLAAPSEIQVLPMLSTKAVDATSSVPFDAKLMVKFLRAPETFMGMQIQVCLNVVKSSTYAYLYCVLLAKAGSGLLKRWAQPKMPDLDIEFSTSEDVEVLVVRQHTTQTSGYSTDEKQAAYVIENAIAIVKQIIK